MEKSARRDAGGAVIASAALSAKVLDQAVIPLTYSAPSGSIQRGPSTGAAGPAVHGGVKECAVTWTRSNGDVHREWKSVIRHIGACGGQGSVISGSRERMR